MRVIALGLISVSSSSYQGYDDVNTHPILHFYLFTNFPKLSSAIIIALPLQTVTSFHLWWYWIDLAGSRWLQQECCVSSWDTKQQSKHAETKRLCFINTDATQSRFSMVSIIPSCSLKLVNVYFPYKISRHIYK